jgi:hypothetical protein
MSNNSDSNIKTPKIKLAYRIRNMHWKIIILIAAYIVMGIIASIPQWLVLLSRNMPKRSNGNFHLPIISVDNVTSVIQSKYLMIANAYMNEMTKEDWTNMKNTNHSSIDYAVTEYHPPHIRLARYYNVKPKDILETFRLHNIDNVLRILDPYHNSTSILLSPSIKKLGSPNDAIIKVQVPILQS